MARGKKTGGRTKGTPNKTTATVKEALIEAFDKLGGVDSLVSWGTENPTPFYQLWTKILPQEVHNTVTGANGGAIEISDTEKAAKLAGLIALAQQRKGISED